MQSSRLITTPLISANVKFLPKVRNHHYGTISFVFSIKSIGWRLKVLGPGGDNSSSGGEGNLGAAQSSLEV